MSFEDDWCILTSFSYHYLPITIRSCKACKVSKSLEFCLHCQCIANEWKFPKMTQETLRCLRLWHLIYEGMLIWYFAKMKTFSNFNFAGVKKMDCILTCKAFRVVRLIVDCTVSCNNFLWVLQAHFSHSLYKNWRWKKLYVCCFKLRREKWKSTTWDIPYSATAQAHSLRATAKKVGPARVWDLSRPRRLKNIVCSELSINLPSNHNCVMTWSLKPYNQER